MYDLMIIGSGPAGLSAAIYAKRAALEAVAIEKDYMGMGRLQ
ncbi:MAG: FAD-dependent oxidoreductase [Ruminococcus sp.]|nr:FAD-dependent oxidoreductase [Ruminococcus sp.]